MSPPVRTRIAPSPTGMLHLGTARTALYSWAYARHHGGSFVLRIEDTDLERSTEHAVQVIIDSLRWLGLDHDEGPIRQTERRARYAEVIAQMLADGRAYRCYASRDELDALREQQRARGDKPRYDGRWRPEQAAGRTPPVGVDPVIRFRNPDHGAVGWDDQVYGPIEIANAELDDLVIARADGMPTYNFAVVVDDIDMAITHVIRGADHINNTPRQINIYRALGAPLPRFAHLPLIHGPDGEKLSKRHGAVSVLQYDDDGFLPEALVNYLARLGWGHGDAEKFTREQLVAWFDLAAVSRAPAQYNLDKLLWLNQQYIKEVDDSRLATLVRPRLAARLDAAGAGSDGAPGAAAAIDAGPDLVRAVALVKDRAHTLNELADALLLFYGPAPRDDALLAQHLQGASLEALRIVAARAPALAWTRADLAALMKAVLAETGLKMPALAVPLRVAVTGRTQTPSLDAVLELLGRDTVLTRLTAALADANAG